MVSIYWDVGYEDLLELVGLPPLEHTIQNYSWPVSLPHWDFYSQANSSQLQDEFLSIVSAICTN